MDEVTPKLLLEYLAYAGQGQVYRRNRARKLLARAARVLLRDTGIAYRAPRWHPVDVLFLHHYAGAADRIAGVASLLEASGLVVRHQVVASPSRMILERQLTRPSADLPPELLLAAAHARFLVRRHEPKVLVTMQNGLLLAPFLREEMRGRGVYVNISHGVTPNRAQHSVTAYDYYFLFGSSSLENLLENPVRIGTTAAVLTGSPFMNYTAGKSADRADPRKALFFSTWFPPGDHYRYLAHTAKTVVEWARANPQYELAVKLHPVEDPAFMTELTRGIPNVRLLPKAMPMEQALLGRSFVLHAHSNASLEAAMAGKPSVIVNASNIPDEYLRLERFFLPRAADVQELNDRVKRLEADASHMVRETRQFLSYHLERMTDSVPYIADCLARLSRGESLRDSVCVAQETSGLRPPSLGGSMQRSSDSGQWQAVRCIGARQNGCSSSSGSSHSGT